MRDLNLGGAIPDRAWVGWSPQEWRSCAEDDPERVLQYAQADLSFLRKATKRRKLKECRMIMSHTIQIREFNRASGKLMFSIQAIQGTVNRRAGTSLSLEVLAEQEAWVADQPIPLTEEIQEAINKTMATPHTTPEEWRKITGIHDASVKWADIQNYITFRQVFSRWKLPGGTLVRLDEILPKIQHALMAVPNRPKVLEALEDTLLGAPPSFEEYLRAIGSRSSKSAGGLIGLPYALMKHWPEKIIN